MDKIRANIDQVKDYVHRKSVIRTVPSAKFAKIIIIIITIIIETIDVNSKICVRYVFFFIY